LPRVSGEDYRPANGRIKLEVEYESLYGERFETKVDLENQ
jgi:hypothetical protein